MARLVFVEKCRLCQWENCLSWQTAVGGWEGRSAGSVWLWPTALEQTGGEAHVPPAAWLGVLGNTGTKLQTVAGLMHPAYISVFCSEHPV